MARVEYRSMEAAVEGSFKLHESSDDGAPHPKDNLEVQLDQFERRWIPHPKSDVDLCVLPAAQIIDAAAARCSLPSSLALRA